VRLATKDDCASIMDLIMELAVFEKLPEQVRITKETLIRDGFESDPPYFQCFVAVNDSRVIGYALYFYSYSTTEGGQGLYLEDLYVTESMRGLGVGSRLFIEVAKQAVATKSFCMQWCVLNWNMKAINFYKSLGAFDLTLKDKWNMYRIDEEGLHSLCQ